MDDYEPYDATMGLRPCTACGGWYKPSKRTKSPSINWTNWKQCDCGCVHKQV
jgi:hypothetical protein